MTYKSYWIYDDDDFFEKYNQKRSIGDAPNEVIEQPIIDELLGDISAKKILDLGCGDGSYGVVLLKRGAKYYHGIEGSQKMARLAKKNLKGYPSEIQSGDIEEVAYPPARYDIVIARLVLHYVYDLASILKKIKGCLKKEGRCIFSVEHPLITSCYQSYDAQTKRTNWMVDHYFDTGERTHKWLGKKVVKYHKTIEDYWQIINNLNLEIVALRESKPKRSFFKNEDEYNRRNRIPLYLIVSLKKNQP